MFSAELPVVLCEISHALVCLHAIMDFCRLTAVLEWMFIGPIFTVFDVITNLTLANTAAILTQELI